MKPTTEQIKQLIGDHPELVLKSIIAILDHNINDELLTIDGCAIEIRKALTPKLKPVDMRALIGLECEFWYEKGNSKTIGQLVDVPGIAYKTHQGWTFNHCQPRLNHVFTRDLFDNKLAKMEAHVKKLNNAGFEVVGHFLTDNKWTSPYGFSITGVREGYTLGGCDE